MKISWHCHLKELRVGVCSDAAWAVRPDGSSQGGMLTFIASGAELQSAKPFKLTVIDWPSASADVQEFFVCGGTGFFFSS